MKFQLGKLQDTVRRDGDCREVEDVCIRRQVQRDRVEISYPGCGDVERTVGPGRTATEYDLGLNGCARAECGDQQRGAEASRRSESSSVLA